MLFGINLLCAICEATSLCSRQLFRTDVTSVGDETCRCLGVTVWHQFAACNMLQRQVIKELTSNGMRGFHLQLGFHHSWGNGRQYSLAPVDICSAITCCCFFDSVVTSVLLQVLCIFWYPKPVATCVADEQAWQPPDQAGGVCSVFEGQPRCVTFVYLEPSAWASATNQTAVQSGLCRMQT